MSASKTLPFVLVLVGLLLLPRLAWWDREPLELSMGIAGPPPGPDGSHPPRGLTWILDHIKARPIGRQEWGLAPGELSPGSLRTVSIVYLTGALPDVMAQRGGSESEGLVATGAKGWLRGSDGRALSAFRSKGGGTIAEGGLLATLLDPEARWRVEDCFRVRWTGWVGLSVDDIGDPSETPRWILDDVVRAGETVPASGSAVLLVKGERVLILRAGLELQEETHELVTLSSNEPLADDLPARVPYRGWFDVVQAKGGGEVLVEHRIGVTEWGAQKLSAAGLSESFPCLVRYRGAHVSYYLAVALSQAAPREFWVPIAGYPRLAALLAARFGGKREAAYWRFFYPLIRGMALEMSMPQGAAGA